MEWQEVRDDYRISWKANVAGVATTRRPIIEPNATVVIRCHPVHEFKCRTDDAKIVGNLFQSTSNPNVYSCSDHLSEEDLKDFTHVLTSATDMLVPECETIEFKGQWAVLKEELDIFHEDVLGERIGEMDTRITPANLALDKFYVQTLPTDAIELLRMLHTPLPLRSTMPVTPSVALLWTQYSLKHRELGPPINLPTSVTIWVIVSELGLRKIAAAMLRKIMASPEHTKELEKEALLLIGSGNLGTRVAVWNAFHSSAAPRLLGQKRKHDNAKADDDEEDEEDDDGDNGESSQEL